MTKSNPSPFKAPLPWFLLIGLVIFAIDGWLANSSNQQNHIQITEGQMQSLVDKWQAQMGRSPTVNELEALLEGRVKEEVLYREALKLGLDEEDTIIRRRLAQKMTFLMEDTLVSVQSSDEILQAYFNDHREVYQIPEKLTFIHVYYSGNGQKSVERAQQGLMQLTGGADPNQLGDPFMLRKGYTGKSWQELARLLGKPFADSLTELSISDTWQGPIESAYGNHLVLLERKSEVRHPAFAEVRDRVLADYQSTEQRRLNEENYQKLRARYKVILPGTQ